MRMSRSEFSANLTVLFDIMASSPSSFLSKRKKICLWCWYKVMKFSCYVPPLPRHFIQVQIKPVANCSSSFFDQC